MNTIFHFTENIYKMKALNKKISIRFSGIEIPFWWNSCFCPSMNQRSKT